MNQQKRSRRIAVTLGDPAGIGPEISARALAEGALPESVLPVVYGSEQVWKSACRIAGVPDVLQRIPNARQAQSPSLVVCEGVDAALAQPGAWTPGKISDATGFAQLRFLQQAADDLVNGEVDGLVTAPVNKAAIVRTGLEFTGHTEFLQERFQVPRVVMLMAGSSLKVALATTHMALSRVPQALNVDLLVDIIRITHEGLSSQFGLKSLRIAVLGLNPHAGEEGSFGDEEGRIVSPAINQARKLGMDVEGPFAADGYFAHFERLKHDVVVALYHDQGLIPFKMIDGATGVNVTLGLPKPRTSPDHGVAYDIASRGIADSRSMASAMQLCAKMVA